MSKLIREMKERRIWRVLIVYPSITFVLLQAIEFFINHYGLDVRFLTIGLVVAIVLLPAAFIWNWRHGEVGEQAFSKVEVGGYLVFGIAALVSASWYWSITPKEPVRTTSIQKVIPTIAVMPFENPAGDAEIQYLCDGISESLINWLASIPNVKVVSKSASFRMRSDSDDLEKLAEALGADSVLRGKLETVNGQLSVSASLVNTKDETQLWGERLIKPVEEVLFLEQTIVAALKTGLSLSVADEGGTEAKGGETQNPEAYQKYLRGHFLIQATDIETIEQGLDELRAAIRIDPAYARPYADIADSLSQIVSYGMLEGDELVGEARNAAYTAVALAPGLAESQTALATMLQYQDFEFAKIDVAYEAAIALEPKSPVPYHRYADYLSVTLRFDRAAEMVKRAIEIDPLDSSSLHAVGWSKLLAGDFAGSAKAFEDWNRFRPQSWWSYTKHSVALSLDNQCDAVLSQADKLMELSQGRISPLMESWMAWSYQNCGFDDRYQQAINNIKAVMSERPDELNPGYAYLFAMEDRQDELVDFLNRVFEAKHYMITFSQIFLLDYLGWPISGSMQADPAYLALLDRIGFPPNPVRGELSSGQ